MERDIETKKWLYNFLRQKFMGKKEYNREKNKDYREPSVPSYEIWTLFTRQPVQMSVGTDRNFSKNTNDVYKAAF